MHVSATSVDLGTPSSLGLDGAVSAVTLVVVVHGITIFLNKSYNKEELKT